MKKFQSTRPMRGATRRTGWNSAARWYFNPRAPCGARRQQGLKRVRGINISIHAPHAGRDAPLQHF